MIQTGQDVPLRGSQLLNAVDVNYKRLMFEDVYHECVTTCKVNRSDPETTRGASSLQEAWSSSSTTETNILGIWTYNPVLAKTSLVIWQSF